MSLARGAPAPFVDIERGDRVAVTGASGFIGSAIARRLLLRGARVVALTTPGGDHQNIRDLDIETRDGDVRDAASVRKAFDGCRYVFHTAALYSFWAERPSLFYAVNVEGTRNVVDAALWCGVERVVYTSTVGTVGLSKDRSGPGATEAHAADVSRLNGRYKQSKYAAEHEVLRLAAEGAPVVLVLPTFPLGPRDRRPTPTGKVVVDVLNGRMPGYVDTVLNIVHVDDLAEGHLRALERGRIGRSYIVGGENLTMRELLSDIARASGLRPVTRRFPHALAIGAGLASEMLEGRLLGHHPSVPLEAARMSVTTMAFDDTRARQELGYTSRPAGDAISDSVRWFSDHGYVSPRRRALLGLRRTTIT